MKLIDNAFSKIRGRVEKMAKETVEKTAPVVEREIKKITSKTKDEIVTSVILTTKVVLVVGGGLYLLSSISEGTEKAATNGANITYNVRITNNYYGVRPV